MQSDFLNDVNNYFQQETEKENEFGLIDKEVIKLFWNFLFEKIAEHFKNEKLKLSEAENELLTNASVKWLNYRLPALFLKYSVDFEFIFALLSVLSAKIIIIRNEKLNNTNLGEERNGENNISEKNNTE